MSDAPFSGSYDPADVTFLLRPVDVAFTDVTEKERLIQSGERHYSELLSPEAVPDAAYLALFREALARNAARLHGDVATLAARAVERHGRALRILSLARAGTPVGVLLHRRLRALGVDSVHYSLSVVRGRGVDAEALRRVARRHGTGHALFVDGWTGKGAIAAELRRSVPATGFDPELAVVADPAGCADLAATVDDYVLPSGLLNGIVSGLVSRSVTGPEHVPPGALHACRFQAEHASDDLSGAFVRAVEAAPATPGLGTPWTPGTAARAREALPSLLDGIARDAGVDDVNRIKPGIAEATRALLRRVPDALYLADADDPEVRPLLHLARAKGVPVRPLASARYRAVTVIRRLGPDGSSATRGTSAALAPCGTASVR